MSRDPREEVIEFVRENPEVSAPALALRFPGIDIWTLKTIRREVAREGSIAERPMDTVVESAALGLTKSAQAILKSGLLRPVTLALTERPKVKPIFKKAGTVVMVINDLHAPDVDWDALDVTLQIAMSLGIDRLIINGDGFDVHSLSSYTPAAHRPFRWADERLEAIKTFIEIRETLPQTPIDFIFGNHCVRPAKFIAAQAPQLQGLFDLPTMLGITDLGFNYPEHNRVILADAVLVKHGTKVAGEAGASVAKEVREHGMSVVMGHVHRLAYYGVTRTAQVLHGEQPLFGVENGCLCNTRPDYMDEENTANWQQGASIFTIHDSGVVIPELVQIHHGRAYFRGVSFVSRRPRQTPK